MAILTEISQPSIEPLSEASTLIASLRFTVSANALRAPPDVTRHDLAVFLNQLVGCAHPVVYNGGPVVWRQLRTFYARDFPRLYCELAPFMLAAARLFFGMAEVRAPTSSALRLPLPVLDRLGDVRRLDALDAGQVGDGARSAACSE